MSRAALAHAGRRRQTRSGSSPCRPARLRRCDVESLQAEKVVRIDRLAVLHVQAPAAEAAGLGEDHAVGAALRDLHLGGDRVRPVLDVDEDVLRHPGHALVDRQRGAAGHQVGPPDEGGVEPLERCGRRAAARGT